ncbi:MAG: DUF2339 domain-containing protein [Chitinophagaceae bacterium]|nr:DUF2339 domain-containing protein [Chitinophagaceae bacterium]
MELLAVVLLLIIFFVLLSFKSSVNENLKKLENELNDLRKSIKEIKSSPSTETYSKKESATQDYWESGFKVVEQPFPAKPSLQEEANQFIKQNEGAELPAKKMQEETKQNLTKTIEVKETITPPRTPIEKIREPSFFERHPDLEKFIGENLISKVGIAILVLAIGYFVKYAIDKNWIGPVARVGIGILCGGILITLAHHLRKNYKGFSSVLVGGGLAIFYFTIALAYHQFHLFSQTISFIIMVVITIFAVVLSMLYDRQELAVIALVGGFATPLLVSDGGGNFMALFTYLLILNAGLLVIAYNRSWRILNTLAFGFTVILFLLWVFGLSPQTPRRTYLYGFLFATAFYVLFFIINIANNVKENKKFVAFDFSILLSNTALYFSAGLYFLHAMGSGEYQGLFTALLGALNLSFSWALFRKQSVDKNIFYLLIGITVSFISLTAPVQLQGNNITLFWASECVLLYWLYLRSKIPLVGLASMIVWIAMLLSLLMDWVQFYLNIKPAFIIFNKGFVTTIYAAICSYLIFLLRKKDSGKTMAGLTSKLPANVYRIAGVILLYMSGALEIQHQFSRHFPEGHVKMQYLLLYTYSFVIIFYLVINRQNNFKKDFSIHFYLLLACLAIYLFSITENFAFLYQVLLEKRYSAHLIAHWTAIVVLALIFFFIVKTVRNRYSTSKNLPLVTWLLCSWIVIYLSSEINLVIQSVYSSSVDSLAKINQSYIKSGLPILWGLCSFAFMWLGMKHKYRPLRIISLVLFSLTLIKLFAFDIRNISAGGKIAAFFCLGVLLLIISFMYQRLKKIIIEDAEKPAA